MLGILFKREGFNFIIKEGIVFDYIERVYRRVGSKKFWLVVCCVVSFLSKVVDSLVLFIINVLV